MITWSPGQSEPQVHDLRIVASSYEDVGILQLQKQNAIEHGDSGSPVFDEYGELIGIVSAVNDEGVYLSHIADSYYLLLNVVELALCDGNATASTNLDLDKRQTAVEAQVVYLMNLVH